MEKELIFHILEIEETKDQEAIKTAYRRLLKTVNPEDDPEGFKRLRQAYEEAVQLLRYSDAETLDEEPKTEIDLWIDRVAELYKDLLSREGEEQWKELLRDPVCEELDTSYEARERMLSFLMEHSHLTHKVWKLIDKTFEYSKSFDELCERYPKNFLKYMNYYVKNETFFPYEFFEYREASEEERNGDAYINGCLRAKQILDAGETEQKQKMKPADEAEQVEEIGQIEQALADLKAYGYYHPYEKVQFMRLCQRKKEMDKAVLLADELARDYAGDSYIMYYVSKIKWEIGEREQAYHIWQRLMEEDSSHHQAKRGIIDYLMEKEDYYQSREYAQNLLEVGDYDEELEKLLNVANDHLIKEYYTLLESEEAPAHFPREKLIFELGWCLFQNERKDEAFALLKTCEPNEMQVYDYNNLYGSLLYDDKKYDKALPYLKKMLLHIETLEDDGTEETRRCIRRKYRTSRLIGLCLHEVGDYEQAEQALLHAMEAAETPRERIESMYDLANILLEEKKYEKAVDASDRLIKEDEGYYPAYLVRQKAAYEMQKGQQVIDDYHKAVEIYPSYYQPYMYAAEVFFFHEQYEDAKDVLETARENQIEFTPRMRLYEVRILRNLAQDNEQRRVPKEILKEIANNINKEDCDIVDTSEVEFEMALLCWEDGDITEALPHMELAIKQNPQRMQYRFVRGNIYSDQEDYEKALTEFETAREVYANEAVLYFNMAYCYDNLKQEEQAIKFYEMCLEQQPAFDNVCERVSDYYMEKYSQKYSKKDLERAIFYMDMQLANVENCYYLVCRGLLYMNSYQIERAIEDFEKAKQYSPEDWAVWNNLGNCYKYLGDFEKAIACLKKAEEYEKEKEKQTGLPNGNMADCYAALGDYKSAIECCERNLALFPEHQVTLEEIGDNYLAMGEYDKALRYYERVSVLDKMSADRKIGGIYLRQDKIRKAFFSFTKERNSSGVSWGMFSNEVGEFCLDTMMWYRRATIYFKQAIINYSYEIKDPNNKRLFEVELNLAQAYFMRGKKYSAMKCTKRAMEYFKKSEQGTEEDYFNYPLSKPNRLLVLGWIKLCLGEEEKAIECFQKMDQVLRCSFCTHAKCYESTLNLARFYETKGNIQRAIELFEETLRRNPDNQPARLALKKYSKR